MLNVKQYSSCFSFCVLPFAEAEKATLAPFVHVYCRSNHLCHIVERMDW